MLFIQSTLLFDEMPAFLTLGNKSLPPVGWPALPIRHTARNRGEKKTSTECFVGVSCSHLSLELEMLVFWELLGFVLYEPGA